MLWEMGGEKGEGRVGLTWLAWLYPHWLEARVCVSQVQWPLRARAGSSSSPPHQKLNFISPRHQTARLTKGRSVELQLGRVEAGLEASGRTYQTYNNIFYQAKCLPNRIYFDSNFWKVKLFNQNPLTHKEKKPVNIRIGYRIKYILILIFKKSNHLIKILLLTKKKNRSTFNALVKVL